MGLGNKKIEFTSYWATQVKNRRGVMLEWMTLTDEHLAHVKSLKSIGFHLVLSIQFKNTSTA